MWKKKSNRVGKEKLLRGGTSFPSLESAIKRILKVFYLGRQLPKKPLNRKTPTATERNAEIRLKHSNGVSVVDLANEYGISVQRVHQILKQK